MKKTMGVLVLTMTATVAMAQETYTATAEVKNAAGAKKTAPISVTIDHLSTPAERDALMAALSGGQDKAKTVLEGMKDAGWIEAESKKIPIKYAFSRPTGGGGKVVTVVAPQPIAHLGGDLPDAKPKTGYDFTLVFLVLDAQGRGHGEFHPASKIKVQQGGAIATAGYGADTVWLVDIVKK